MWLLFVACSGLQSSKADDGAVVILSVEPDRGPPEGGTAVVIEGEGFTDDAEVYFGELDVDATRLDETHIVAVSPALGIEATVSLEVRGALGEAEWPNGFLYTDGEDDSGTTTTTWDSDSDTDSDSDSDADSDADTDTDTTTPGTGVGMIGGVIEFSRTQIACPACIGAASEFDVYAMARIHEPSNGSWTDWMPYNGSCQNDPAPVTPGELGYDLGSWIYLTVGSESLGLRSQNDTGTTYDAGALSVDDYISNASYTLEVPDGGVFGSFSVPNAVLAPDGFSDIQPFEMLYTNPASAFSASISQSGQTFTWDPYGGSGTFVILISVYSSDGVTYYGSVMCQDGDTGSMYVPGGYLGGYPRGSLVTVTLVRYQIERFVVPFNGSEVESVGKSGVLGTGVIGR